MVGASRSKARSTGRIGSLVLLGITLLPSGFLLFVYVMLFRAWATGQNLRDIDLNDNPLGILAVIPYLLFILVTGGLYVWYLWDAGVNPALDSTTKIIWVLVILQFSFVAMPVYWYLYIWKGRTDVSTP